MSVRTRVATLRQMLFELEREVGLQQMSSSQRDIYYAACLLGDEDEVVNSDALREHPLLRDMPRSSFFRVLKELVSLGYLRSAGSPRSGLYRLVK